MQRFLHAGPVHNGWGRAFDGPEFACFEGLAVDGAADGIHYPAQEGIANGHIRDVACAAHDVACGDGFVIRKQHRAHPGAAQFQRHAESAAFKGEKLAIADTPKAVDLHDAVRAALHHAISINGRPLGKAADAAGDMFADGLQGFHRPYPSCRCLRIPLSWVRRLISYTRPPT